MYTKEHNLQWMAIISKREILPCELLSRPSCLDLRPSWTKPMLLFFVLKKIFMAQPKPRQQQTWIKSPDSLWTIEESIKDVDRLRSTPSVQSLFLIAYYSLVPQILICCPYYWHHVYLIQCVS
jgi:hypothetical protein